MNCTEIYLPVSHPPITLVGGDGPWRLNSTFTAVESGHKMKWDCHPFTVFKPTNWRGWSWGVFWKFGRSAWVLQICQSWISVRDGWMWYDVIWVKPNWVDLLQSTPLKTNGWNCCSFFKRFQWAFLRFQFSVQGCKWRYTLSSNKPC